MSPTGIAISISPELQNTTPSAGAPAVDHFIQQDTTDFVQQDGSSLFIPN